VQVVTRHPRNLLATALAQHRHQRHFAVVVDLRQARRGAVIQLLDVREEAQAAIFRRLDADERVLRLPLPPTPVDTPAPPVSTPPVTAGEDRTTPPPASGSGAGGPATPPGSGGTGITLTAPLANTHLVGVTVYGPTATDPTGDMTKVFGATSTEWNEGLRSQKANPGTALRNVAQTDFVGIAIHCAAGHYHAVGMARVRHIHKSIGRLVLVVHNPVARRRREMLLLDDHDARRGADGGDDGDVGEHTYSFVQ
jgi:hypothetical protein